jgi:hypothetical protein
MKNMQHLFPGFHIQTLSKKRRSTSQKLADELEALKQKSFQQLGEVFGSFIPKCLLKPSKEKAFSRRRVYFKENVFWAFFSQVMDPDGGCREVVKKLQAYASARGLAIPSSSTASYCTARGKLQQETLSHIFDHTAKQLDNAPDAEILKGRRVVVVDGTGISMPDSEENQAVWPQQSQQKPGCGFPTARICACFNLQNGALLSYRIGSKKNHELPLLREQADTFRRGDIFLGDKGFCCYYDFALFQERGIDSVATLARRTPVSKAKAVKVLGNNDLLIEWKRPYYQKNKMPLSREEWKKLPPKLLLRQIKVTVDQPGFRVKEFYLVTTLLDPIDYPVDELADLYFQRWDVELFFRDIKSTMKMDILRCRTPDMIRKEILMHFIAYNCIRRLMLEAALEEDLPVRLISFKGSLQALRSWEPHLNHHKNSKAERRRMIADLHEAIADVPIKQRPGRSEPRAVKRRPKPFQLLTAPREEMKETPHRGKRHAKAA